MGDAAIDPTLVVARPADQSIPEPAVFRLGIDFPRYTRR